MTEKTYTNSGPAFPGGSYLNKDYDMVSDGMSLRDYFAAQALTGLLATYTTDEVAWEKVAGRAYGLADAMLIVRET